MATLRYIFVFFIVIFLSSHVEVWANKNKPETIEKTLTPLLATKDALEKRLEQHRQTFRQNASTHRHNWKKKIKTSPKAKSEYKTGLFLLKKLGELDEEIYHVRNGLNTTQTLEQSILEELRTKDLPNIVKNEINHFYRKSAESLTNELRRQQIVRSRTSQIQHKWLWSLMAIAIVSQAHILPACAQPIQHTTLEFNKNEIPQTFQCYSPSFNRNQSISLLQNQPMILPPSVSHPPAREFLYAIPELAANARALKESIQCVFYPERPELSKSEKQKYSGLALSCPIEVMKKWPDYNENPQIVGSFYDNIKGIGAGGSNAVYSADIHHAREDLPAGSKIAIRVVKRSQHSLPRAGLSFAMRAYSRLSILRNYKGYPVSEYYPEHYGVYFGPQFPSLKPEGEGYVDMGMMYMEMEYVDTFFDIEYAEGNKIPDNVIFEQKLGEWASQKIAKIVITDGKPRHYGLKNVAYYRAYHIGKDTYLFEPGKSPRRIDLDIWFDVTENMMQQSKADRRERGEEGIFTVFSKDFSAYKVSEENPIPLNHPVRHYYVPDEYLGDM